MLMLGKTSESEVSSHLYDLIFELNQIAPNVLFAVLPQLEFKLKVSSYVTGIVLEIRHGVKVLQILLLCLYIEGSWPEWCISTI